MGKVREDLLNEISQCKKCNSIKQYLKFPSESHGNLKSEYMLVSEAPGYNSIIRKQYWTGQSGMVLRQIIGSVGSDLESLFYLTDIVKCWPGNGSKNRKPSKEEIINCGHFIKDEIAQLQPKIILAFGKTASEAILNRSITLKKEHGKLSKINNSMVLVLFHPSNINLHMNVNIYLYQLKNLFQLIVQRDLDNIEKVFKIRRNIYDE